ncbi:hypothetical protein N7465_006512 [Penicillium sp. CMV-2018d]|nr:hypothetical protein N7465_006512 [Penicillium sp. CMV-2018d]
MYSGLWLKPFTFWAGPSRVIDLCEHLHGIRMYPAIVFGSRGTLDKVTRLLTSLESDVRIQTKRMYHRIRKEYEVERKREKERKRKRENVCVDQPIVHHIPRF